MRCGIESGEILEAGFCGREMMALMNSHRPERELAVATVKSNQISSIHTALAVNVT